MSTRRKIQRQNRFSSLEQQTKMVLGDPDAQFVVNNNPSQALSGALLKLIEPYRQYTDGKDQVEKMLMVAMTAWNSTVVSPAAAKKLLKAMLEEVGDSESQALFASLVVQMVATKEQLFASDKRLIISFEVKERKNRYDVQVTSTNL
jgi:hypothetical protein